MTAASRYCSHCGKPLNPTANFCASCGKSVAKIAAPPPAPAPPAAAAPVPPAVPQEAVVGVIPGAVRRSGLLGLKGEGFVIVLTNLRIIFAAQTAQMLRENVQQARDSAKQEGKGFFGQWGAQLKANQGQPYFEMNPQHILTEQPANFFYYANQLRSIRLREEHDNENSISTYNIEFDTPGGKHKFHFNQLDMRGVKKVLQQLYGNIVR